MAPTPRFAFLSSPPVRRALQWGALGGALAWGAWMLWIATCATSPTDGLRVYGDAAAARARAAVWAEPEELAVALPAGRTLVSAAPSPDGAWLALALADASGSTDLYLAPLDPTTGLVRDTPRALTPLNSSARDEAPAWANGALWFATDRAGGAGGLDVWRAVKGRSRFEDIGPVGALNGPFDDTDPAPAPTGGECVIASNRPRTDAPTAADFELWHARALDAAPEHLAELGSPADERDASFAADAQTLWFSSNRDGDQELYRARFSAGAWSAPERVVELGSERDERSARPDASGFTLRYVRGGDGADARWLRARSIELWQVERALTWFEWCVLAALASIALLAWLGARGGRFDTLYRWGVVSVLLHLLLALWLQRVFLGVRDLEEPLDEPIRIQLLEDEPLEPAPEPRVEPPLEPEPEPVPEVEALARAPVGAQPTAAAPPRPARAAEPATHSDAQPLAARPTPAQRASERTEAPQPLAATHAPSDAPPLEALPRSTPAAPPRAQPAPPERASIAAATAQPVAQPSPPPRPSLEPSQPAPSSLAEIAPSASTRAAAPLARAPQRAALEESSAREPAELRLPDEAAVEAADARPARSESASSERATPARAPVAALRDAAAIAARPQAVVDAPAAALEPALAPAAASSSPRHAPAALAPSTRAAASAERGPEAPALALEAPARSEPDAAPRVEATAASPRRTTAGTHAAALRDEPVAATAIARPEAQARSEAQDTALSASAAPTTNTRHARPGGTDVARREPGDSRSVQAPAPTSSAAALALSSDARDDDASAAQPARASAATPTRAAAAPAAPALADAVADARFERPSAAPGDADAHAESTAPAAQPTPQARGERGARSAAPTRTGASGASADGEVRPPALAGLEVRGAAAPAQAPTRDAGAASSSAPTRAAGAGAEAGPSLRDAPAAAPPRPAAVADGSESGAAPDALAASARPGASRTRPAAEGSVGGPTRSSAPDAGAPAPAPPGLALDVASPMRGDPTAPSAPGRLDATPYRSRFGAAKREALEQGGGNERTEEAVARGLRYLASVQRPSGLWGDAGELDEKYGDVRVGKSGLCLLAFLGAGHTPESDTQHSAVVERAIEALLALQDPTSGQFGETEAYGHGIATYALAEAYALTQDARLAAPLERAVARILAAQQRSDDPELAGGWSYYYGDPRRSFDRWPRAAISAWQVMALESARLGGLAVPDAAFEAAAGFLRGTFDEEGGWFRYNHDPVRTSSAWPTLPASTPAALFALSLMDEPLDAPRLDRSWQYVLTRAPRRYAWEGDDAFVLRGAGNVYFWYYATLACFRRGGDTWERWNAAMQSTLLPAQAANGSWRPIDPYAEFARDSASDRSYTTAVCVLCLEVYYRYFTPLLRVR